jgi:predicted  nucleic acid-binding Zn-ribbon protein
MAELRIALEALWRCERESEELARRSAQIPKDIESAEARAQAARASVEAERAKLEQAEHTRREKEAEVQDCEARRTKYQTQTAQVKTNTEYTALLSEIDQVTERISMLEEQILEAMEEVDQVRSTLVGSEVEKKREEQVSLAAAEELRQTLAEVQQQTVEHEQERNKLVGELPANARQPYERMYKGRGAGTTSVKGRSCAACHRDVPYETINRVVAAELQYCPACQRILVVPAE